MKYEWTEDGKSIKVFDDNGATIYQVQGETAIFTWDEHSIMSKNTGEPVVLLEER